MIDVRLIREQRDDLERRLRSRDPSLDLSEIVQLDEHRRELIAQVEALKAERNQGSQEVGRRKREGQDASDLMARLAELSDRVSALDADLREIQGQIDQLLSLLPNVPHESVPTGAKEEYVVLKTVGEKPAFDFPVLHHLELAEDGRVLNHDEAEARVRQYIQWRMYGESPDPPFDDEELGIVT